MNPLVTPLRSFMYFVLFSMVSMMAFAQPNDTTIVLSYRYDGEGLWVDFVDATSVNGTCKIVVRHSTGTGVGPYQGPLDAATFAKLMAGAKTIFATHVTDDVLPGRSRNHHIIELRVQNKDGSKSEKYGVFDNSAPEVFRAWVTLLHDSFPKDKR